MWLYVEDDDDEEYFGDGSQYFLQLDPFNQTIYLNTTSFNDVGVYNVTLTTCIVQGYICTTNFFSVIVLDPCFNTVIPAVQLQEIDYLIG